MCYYASGGQTAGTVFIRKDNNLPALKALLSSNLLPDRFVINNTNLNDALCYLGWSTDMNAEGAVEYIYFEYEKWFTDSEKTLDVIARFVEPGVIIEMTGDDNAHWAYAFKNGTMQEFSGVLTYPGLDEFLKGNRND